MGGKECVLIGCGVFVAILVVIIAIIASSIKILETTEVGIQYNTLTKSLGEEPFHEGLHLGPPGYHFIKFSSVFKTLSFSGVSCRNYDGVPITISVSFQYRVQTAFLMEVIAQFTDQDNYMQILRKVASSAVHDSCSVFNTSQFQSERGRFQADLTERLAEKFSGLHCDVTDLQVNNIHRPRRIESAIQDKESAREDIEVAGNERPRQLTAARTTRREAQTEADIIKDLAQSQAGILTQRASADAQGILNDYMKEAESYKQLKESTGIDNEGFLSYLAVRAIAESENPVHIGMKAPAEVPFGKDTS